MSTKHTRRQRLNSLNGREQELLYFALRSLLAFGDCLPEFIAEEIDVFLPAGCKAPSVDEYRELVQAFQIPGVCHVCGCTDQCACEEGCEWVNRQHTLCSSCA